MESVHPTASAASTHDVRADASIVDAVAQAAPVAVVAMDREARVTFWNAAAERIFGLDADKALGRVPPLLERMPSAEREGILHRVLAGEIVSFVHVESCRRTGRSVRLRATTAPLEAPAGEILGLVAFVTDMETQVRAEAQAAANEQRYRTLFYSAPVGIFETDADGNCVRVNDRWLEARRHHPRGGARGRLAAGHSTRTTARRSRPRGPRRARAGASSPSSTAT